MDKVIVEVVRIYNAHRPSTLFLVGFIFGAYLMWVFILTWGLL